MTKCVSEAQQNQSDSVLNDKDHSREAAETREGPVDLRSCKAGERERTAALEKAARYIMPYLVFTIGDESPGYHPTMPSAVGAFKEVVGAEALKLPKLATLPASKDNTDG